jgi:hypothetical protein
MEWCPDSGVTRLAKLGSEIFSRVSESILPPIYSISVAIGSRTAQRAFLCELDLIAEPGALDGDWRFWVTAISPAKKGVGLRFLYGVLLDDPRHVLRAGSSVLKTWDFALGDAVSPAAVGAYVKEAVAKYGDYKANSAKVLAASRAAARGRTAKRPSP